ncbi:MAG: GTPase Era [Candidatus Magasanikbacteria bacterium]|jgi:GTPase|nr:GTPase Era [Candidatus Magasanikbacteria bacterium]MBT4071600.1 GTPase Era [Candidatus Magasanikbacteria bacterium]
MKSGIVVLVGRSNVGKSTLLNTLVGTKIAATSFRAQLTRNIIHGVLNMPGNEEHVGGQAVFVDTPGVFKDKKSALTSKLTGKVTQALHGIDLIIYVVDPTREIGVEERAVYGMIRHTNTPKILVINKSELSPEERMYQDTYLEWADDFDAVLPLSALRASHITPLKEKVMDLLPEGPPLYGEEQLTNIDNLFWIGEIIREKIFSVMDKEVPYSIAVEVDSAEDKVTANKKEIFSISARILTDEDRYKRIIIGSKGARIKEIGQMARKELEQALNKKIFLELEVEVDRHWVERL